MLITIVSASHRKKSNSIKIAKYYFIADYHALINIHEPKLIKEYIYEVAATWLSLGLDPKKVVLYRQSDIPEISELAWILSCFASKGLLNRAHAYKAACDKNLLEERDSDSGVSMGLFNYPVLMSSDILFIGSDIVPVGADQVQHIEITRDIVNVFNHQYGNVLKLPSALVQSKKYLIPGLDGRKMSKSYNNYIPLFSPSKKLRKMIMKIKTDSTPPNSPKNPKDSVVFDLFSLFSSSDEISEFERSYVEGISWGEAKQRLFEKVEGVFGEPREKYYELMKDKNYINETLESGAQQVRTLAKGVLDNVKSSIGI